MDYLFAALAGLIQGLTEFIPISSSGHLIIFHDIIGFDLPDNLAFDAFLHMGTLLALVAFFFKDIVRIIKAFFSSLVKWDLKNDAYQRLAWMVIIGIIPAGLAGYFLEDVINLYFHDSAYATLVVAFMLVIVAILFFAIENYAARAIKLLEKLKVSDSILIGIAQAIALIPGTSRSGITIIAGMWRGFKREEAARFSFLLSIPVVLGAGVKSVGDMGVSSSAQWPLLAIGFAAAAISGYIAIRFLIRFLSNHSLRAFAWYRLAMGVFIFGWFIFLMR